MNLYEAADLLRDWLNQLGMTGRQSALWFLFLGLVALFILCLIVWAVFRFVLIRIARKLVTKTETTWDDKLFENRVFRGVSFIVIAILIAKAVPVLFRDFPNWIRLTSALSRIYIILSVMFAVNAILNSIVSILEHTQTFGDKPIRSYKQVAKIVFYLIGFVLILAIALGESPLYILGGFGAITAVLLLIFRDPILGFVASVQMSAIDLVRIGDWITVEKYGADGEVMEINLTTVKVRNWDMTITLVPSYALVSDSFKNWRGMQESAGRRIKRHILINISSIRFCDDALYHKLMSLERIRSYLEARHKEIREYNEENDVDKTALLNGRHMTNIGIFRQYAMTYIEENPKINLSMTYMVRQLQPTENGLPIEIYAFTYDKKWEEFELVAADLFDHLLASVPFFELEVFQNPGGSDMRGLRRSLSAETP
ncbi:MAG: mechanosensitive ion channel family protein [Flavobacteriales bacterium]